MRLADRLDCLDRLGGLAPQLLVGCAAVAIGIFLALLTSTSDAHAAGPIHTHHTGAQAAPTHVSSSVAADQNGSAGTARRSGLRSRSHERVKQTSLDPAIDHKSSSTAQTASTSALARDRVPRARPSHHQGVQTSEQEAALPLGQAPPAPTRSHSPVPPDDDPSGPLPTQDALVLQSSPLATSFGPGVPFAFFGLLALLLARRAMSERPWLRTLRGTTLSVPWPPG